MPPDVETTPADLRPELGVEAVLGVGPRKAASLRKLGLQTVRDLLEYLPRDYRTEGNERQIADIVHDQIQTARGEVVATDYTPGRPRSRFEATLVDADNQRLAIVWFNAAYLRTRVRPGMFLRVRGKVRRFRGLPQMCNPKWEAVDDADAAGPGGESYVPVYAGTADVSPEAVARLVADALPAADGLPDLLPEALRLRRDLVGTGRAYRLLHAPRGEADVRRGRRRLVYDELLLMQLALGIGRRTREAGISAPVVRVDRNLDTRIRSRFPFDLTPAQERVTHEMLHDLRSGRPMNRLLQGDVGSGKTVVALYAMLAAVANKLQAVLLAPTEVLASQHFLTLTRFLHGSNVRTALVTGRTKARGGEATLKSLREGEIDLAVGTQALLVGDVGFANLGLVVVDEQHKLGVRQRASLRDRARSPHYLVMTATPIPRTLALSFFADFDVSAIDELPPGRVPVETRHVEPPGRARAYGFVARQVDEGRQAYVVLPQIDDDDLGDVAGVEAHARYLTGGPLAGRRVGILHGRLPDVQKDAVMDDFRHGRLDVLVATTVIEVGVDVPNATVMVIENAERFGLSQLHQLRGRVGRGGHRSWCVLVSDALTEAARTRIEAMCRTTDGFELAETDLKLRGPGDFFGDRQHGLPPLKVADLSQELDTLREAWEDALAILDGDPDLLGPSHAVLREALTARFGRDLGLSSVG